MGNDTGFDTNPLVTAIQDLSQRIQLSSDLQHIVSRYIENSRQFRIWTNPKQQRSFVDHHGRIVYESISYAACIEWALQQPPIPDTRIAELEAQVAALQARFEAQEGDGR